MANESKCPVMAGAHTAVGSSANQHWWPNQLNLKILHQNSSLTDPMGEEFNYAEEFKTLDLDEVQKETFRRIAEEELGAKRPAPIGDDI